MLLLLLVVVFLILLFYTIGFMDGRENEVFKIFKEQIKRLWGMLSKDEKKKGKRKNNDSDDDWDNLAIFND